MGSEPRTRALDGLRGLAALSVVGFHVWLYRPERVPGTRTSLGDQVFFELHLGLICFFVLSGFLLYRGLLRRPNLKRYAVRRIARIVPAYYVSIAGCLILFVALGLDDLVPPTEPLPLFLVFGQNYSSRHAHGDQPRDVDAVRRGGLLRRAAAGALARSGSGPRGAAACR